MFLERKVGVSDQIAIELTTNSKVTLLHDMPEQDWNLLAGRDVEVNDAKENKRDSIMC